MKPILFSEPMVQALIAGTKTQTRRVLKPANSYIAKQREFKLGDGLWVNSYGEDISPCHTIKDYSVSPCWMKADLYIKNHARYEVGDILYVRETWAKEYYSQLILPENTAPPLDENACRYIYKATSAVSDELIWRSSATMPKEAARIFLKVTSVRMERVKRISPEDCVEEGVVKKPHFMKYGGENSLVIHGRYRNDFKFLWDSIYTKHGFGWNANPWVWVYTFKRVSKEGCGCL